MKNILKNIFRLGIVFSLVLVFVAPAFAGVTKYDTNGDGTDDFTLRTSDTDGDGTNDKVHFDTDNDGVEDAGELIINCHRIVSLIAGGGDGAGRHVIVRCDTGTEHVISHYFVRDNNGDGDTSDAGEVEQRQPK